MQKLFLYLFLTGTLLISSCAKHPKTKEQLIEYINDEKNGLKKYSEATQGEFTLSYRPNTLLPGLPVSSQNYWYFILSLRHQERGYAQNFLASEQDSTHAIEQLAFGMDKTTYAVTNTSDTVYCSASIFPRTDGILGADKILLVFENEELEQVETFRMKVDAIAQEFHYKVKDITKIQDVEIEK